MSGEKRRYVSIEEAEARRLRQQDSRLRSLQKDLPERLEAVRRQAQQELQQQISPLIARTQQQEKVATQLKSNLQRLEQESATKLREQALQFRAKLHEAQKRQQLQMQKDKEKLEVAINDGLSQQRTEYLSISKKQRQEYLDLVEKQDEKFENLISMERQTRLREQSLLRQELESLSENIDDERKRKIKLSQDYIADVQAIWEQIDHDYQHNRFTPGRLVDLKRELDLAQGNLEGGIPEAAIATSQRTYMALADLRLELEQKEQEWQLLYHATLTDLRSLIAEVHASRECEVEVGHDSEPETFMVEVDYWVNGRLGDFHAQLTNLERRLEDNFTTLTTEEVIALGSELEQLQPVLSDIVEQAKLNILSSQMRVEIAEQIVEALTGAGYELVDPDNNATYEGDDQRNAYVVKVAHLSGDEVVTVISPEGKFGANTISINTFSETLVDENTTQQNAEAIFTLLDEQGVRGQGKLECNQQAKGEYKSMQDVKQRSVIPKSHANLKRAEPS